ncbi:MAG: glycosyltransferase family 4 protein [Actinobacteria bacterium]|nr:glycosyltransferase family 4 protein [Actinomycetota bacterium]
MRIGIVCPYDLSAPGGVQQVVVDLAGELRRRGDEVVVVAAGRPGGERGEDGAVLVGVSHTVPANRSRAPLTLSPLSWRRVGRALAEVDIVHAHEPLVPLVGWAALRTDHPTVATFHADPPDLVAGVYPWLPFVGRRFREMTLTAVSNVAARAVPDDWGPVEVVPNGVHTESFLIRMERMPNRVCFLGRDEPRKGLDVLLGAWPEIRDRVPEAELLVMGADRGPRDDGVIYLGRVSREEKSRVLVSSQVFVAPNTGGESFGIVLIEAMAAGCAVVCSDLEAFRDVVGPAARVFPVGDRTRLASEVVDLLLDHEPARALGEHGRTMARAYDWEVVGDRYRAVYRRALA